MADDASPPPPHILELTPLNPKFREDPYSMLASLRTHNPVMRDELAGAFLLTRHEDVRAIVTDLTLWRDPARAEPDAVLTRRIVDAGPGDVRRRDGPGSILTMDNPDHARIRTPLAQALYKRVAKARPLVEAVVAEALDRLAGQARFDLMAGVALPIPIDVIARILGVDHTRLMEFRDWSEGLIQGLNPLRNPAQTDHLLRSADAIDPFMHGMLAARRAAPEDDLVTDMVQLKDAGADLSDDELVSNLIALLVGGNLTTTDLIGNGVRQFLLNPDELAKLKAEPGLIGAAVEEILRYDPPVDVTSRVASHEMEVGGCPVHKTQSVWVSLRGANRDPAVFENPDAFDITRKKAPHVAFGGGAHICIGAPLARLEAQVALARLFERFPDLRLAEPDAEPQWRSLPFFRGLHRLDVLA